MWAADPYGRHRLRYHDGRQWTKHVADNGPATIDLIAYPAPGATGTAGVWTADVFGRYHHRFHNGRRWTEHVADINGTVGKDPPEHPPPTRPGGEPDATGGHNFAPPGTTEHRAGHVE